LPRWAASGKRGTDLAEAKSVRLLGLAAIVAMMGLTGVAKGEPPVLPPPSQRVDAPAVDAHLALPQRDVRAIVVTDIQAYGDQAHHLGQKHTIAAAGVRQPIGGPLWVQGSVGMARTSYKFDTGLPIGGAMPAFMLSAGATFAGSEIGLRGWSSINGGVRGRGIQVVAVAFQLRFP